MVYDVTKADHAALREYMVERARLAFAGTTAPHADMLLQTLARHRTAARDQGYSEGIEAAARYIQDQYPHDKRVLVPAIRKLSIKLIEVN